MFGTMFGNVQGNVHVNFIPGNNANNGFNTGGSPYGELRNNATDAGFGISHNPAQEIAYIESKELPVSSNEVKLGNVSGIKLDTMELILDTTGLTKPKGAITPISNYAVSSYEDIHKTDFPDEIDATVIFVKNDDKLQYVMVHLLDYRINCNAVFDDAIYHAALIVKRYGLNHIFINKEIGGTASENEPVCNFSNVDPNIALSRIDFYRVTIK